jgi:hypothetical protein
MPVSGNKVDFSFMMFPLVAVVRGEVNAQHFDASRCHQLNLALAFS